MKQKNTVLAGIVVSSLLTTLVLFQWINYLATAFVVFAGSLVAAFYIALSQARAEQVSERDLLINAIQRLDAQEQEKNLIDQLIYWAAFLVKSESVIYYQADIQTVLGEADEPEVWADACKELAERSQTTLWPGSPAVDNLPPGVKNFLALPVQEDGDHHDLLVLVNRLSPGGYSSQDAALLRVLVRQCKVVLQRFSAENKRASFYQDTISYLILGCEDENGGFKGHAGRVKEMAVKLGRRLGFSDEEMKDLELAALLHDCGKIYTMASYASGQDEQCDRAPTDDHPGRGAGFFPDEERYALIKQGILYHHERYNGSGYPEGLHRNEIPLIASVIAVADVFDALTSLGEEERRLSARDAFKIMKKETGTLFDPLVIVALEELAPDQLELE